MIFLLLSVVILTVWQYVLMARRHGPTLALREIAAAASAGGASGILVGVAARIGMAAIGLANGAAVFTFSGSLAVVMAFVGLGVILGIVYAGLLRGLLRGSGLAYGGILVLCTWYPLAEAGAEDMTARPAAAALVLISGVVVAGMWLPYAVVLERLLSRWRQRGTTRVAPKAAV